MNELKVFLSSIPRANYMFSVKASWPIQEAKESLQKFEKKLFFVLCPERQRSMLAKPWF